MLLGAVGEREERKGFSLCSTGQPCWCPSSPPSTKHGNDRKRGVTRLHRRREAKGGLPAQIQPVDVKPSRKWW